MKLKSKKVKILVIIVIVWLIFFSVDFIRAQNQKRPIFCIGLPPFQDGGTREYLGLGYKVVKFHKIFLDRSVSYTGLVYSGAHAGTHIGTWFMDMDEVYHKYSEISYNLLEEYYGFDKAKELKNGIENLKGKKEYCKALIDIYYNTDISKNKKMALVWEVYYYCDMELLNELEPDLREKAEEIKQIYVEYYRIYDDNWIKKLLRKIFDEN